MMWVHNVRTDARTVGLGGEGRRVVKNGLKIFSYFGGDCPAVVVCCGRGFSSASMREIISMPAPTSIPVMPASTLMRETTSMPAQYLAHRLARIFVQVHDRLPRERPLLFFRVFAADLLPPPLFASHMALLVRFQSGRCCPRMPFGPGFVLFRYFRV